MKIFFSALALGLAIVLPHGGAVAADWMQFRDPQMGVAVDFPAHIFPSPSGERQGRGISFSTPDGHARVRIFSFLRQPGETPRRRLQRIADIRSARFTYVRTTARFFAASGIINGEIFYRRCNFSGSNRRVSCVELFYPQAEKRAWDGLVTRMSRSLRTFG